jgi:hypothetical protein
MPAEVRQTSFQPERFLFLWVTIYAFGLVLFPHIGIAGKQIYAAEWMLLPLLGIVVSTGFRYGWKRPPVELVLLWLGLVVTFAAGYFRENFAARISLYVDIAGIQEERFQWGQDAIRWVRWTLLFSLPWLMSQLAPLRISVIALKSRFLDALKIAVLISAFLTITEWTEWFDLASLYGPNRHPLWWSDRSFGTFASPLEASLVYALMPILVVTEDQRAGTRGFVFKALVIIASLFALAFTRGTSAACALVATLGYFVYLRSSSTTRKIWVGLTLSAVVSVFIFVPQDYLFEKLVSLHNRTRIWLAWIYLLKDFPRAALTGIGFANVTIDNSAIMMLVVGGLAWFVPAYLWLRKLVVGATADLRYAFIFWIFSWCTLDSIGYWGIGRILWMMIGFLALERAAARFKTPVSEAWTDEVYPLDQTPLSPSLPVDLSSLSHGPRKPPYQEVRIPV